jgi:AcrR family transcriptional regulator
MSRTTANDRASRKFDFARDDIGGVAIRLFARRGFDAVSVDDIAVEAGISQRTFFRYFASKDDILLHAERHNQQRLIEALRALPAELGPVSALRRAYLDTSTVPSAARPEVRRRGDILAGSPGLRARLQGEVVAVNATIAAVLAERMGVDPDQDVRPHVIASALSAVAVNAWHRWVASSTREDPSSVIAQAFDVLDQGWEVLDVNS